MVKTYKKKKDQTKKPNATGPKYRTPDFMKGRSFSGKASVAKKGFSPVTFKKTQHKG